MTARGPETLGRRASPRFTAGGRGGPLGTDADALIIRLEQRIARLEAQQVGGPDRRPNAASPVSARHVLMILGMVVAVLATITLGYLAWKGISLVLIAILFALALNPAVEFFVARGLSRGSAAAIVFILALLVVGVLGLLLIPPLVAQVSNFINALPDVIASLSRGHGVVGNLERRFHVLENLPGAVAGGTAAGGDAVARSGLGVVMGVLGAATRVVIVAFLTFFLLLEGPTWSRRLLALVPDASRPRYERVAYGIYRTVGGFVSGNLVASLLAGLTTCAVLVATGVAYAIPLALLVAFLDLLPVFGMIVALVVMAAVSFSHSFVAGVVVVAFMFVYHQFEVYILRPLIYGRTVELSPLAVLASVVIGTELAGVIGALAAIPLAGAANVVVCEVLRARADAREQQIVSPALETERR